MPLNRSIASRSARENPRRTWESFDAILLPSAGTIYTIEQMLADPIQLNTNLGRYTNFMNLLDLCGLAVPAGFRSDNVPFGVTFFAPAWRRAFSLQAGARVRKLELTMPEDLSTIAAI